MINKYKIIGVDLSKASTGISLVEVEDFNLKILKVFSLKQFLVQEFNKFYFYSKNVLINEIEKILKKHGNNCSVAFEFNIFGSYASELQFYLTQELIALCFKYHIDMVGYSPFFLKKFIKSFVTNKEIKYPGRLNKNHIRSIYERFIYPLNETILPVSKNISDDDSMDALFLGLLGSIFQGKFLSEKRHSYKILVEDPNYYHTKFVEEIEEFKLNNFRYNDMGIEFRDQFKLLLKDAKRNHLSLESKIFFPFHKLNLLTEEMISWRLKNKVDFYFFWEPHLHRKSRWLEEKYSLDRDFVCLCNKKGKIFLYPIER
jgi:hypothetical protein